MIDWLLLSYPRPIEVAEVALRRFTETDLALLKLENKMDYGSGIMPICLPQVNPPESYYQSE